MTRNAVRPLILAALSAAGAAGFWLGRHGPGPVAVLALGPAMSSPGMGKDLQSRAAVADWQGLGADARRESLERAEYRARNAHNRGPEVT